MALIIAFASVVARVNYYEHSLSQRETPQAVARQELRGLVVELQKIYQFVEGVNFALYPYYLGLGLCQHSSQ